MVTTPVADPLARAVRTYLDHLSVERGLAANTLASYRRDLRRWCELLAARGHAVTDATPDDVKAVAVPVVAHRLLLRPAARAEHRASASVVEDVLAQVPQPDPRPAERGG